MHLPLPLLLLLLFAPAATAQDVPMPRERPAAIEEAAAPEESPEEAVPEESPEEAVPEESPEEAVPEESPEAVPPLPRTRPADEAEAPAADDAGGEAVPPTVDDAPPAADEDVSAEPPEPPEPPRIYQTACPAVIAGLVEAEMLPPLVEGSCGEGSPLMVTGVMASGRMVPLSSPATLNCAMATAVPDWIAAVDNYLWARENTRIARILSGTSFMCRGRNRVVGADISEHGFANALDVTGFELEDGRSVTLPGDWTDAQSPGGRLLRFAHDAACARFTTTLGPESNALHADHLHVDMGCHGKNCTARLCE